MDDKYGVCHLCFYRKDRDMCENCISGSKFTKGISDVDLLKLIVDELKKKENVYECEDLCITCDDILSHHG